MERSKLWLAISALSAAAGPAAAQDQPERAGAVTTLQPEVQAKIGDESARVLIVGSDVYRNELVRTDVEGVAHLMFTDKSSLTIGPSSEVILDEFVYDPDTGTGKLALSATKGVLRFVGGALSKTDDVEINTPLGRLGIRGGGMYSRIEANRVLACMFYGEQLSGTNTISNQTKKVDRLEQCLELRSDGSIEEVVLTAQIVDEFFEEFSGEETENPPDPALASTLKVMKGGDLDDFDDPSPLEEETEIENTTLY